MRRFFLSGVLAFLCGVCACGAPLERSAATGLGRHRRLGVLPFSDSQGRGRELAERVGRGLSPLGFDPVDVAQLEAVFARLGLDYSSGLSRQSLAEIRRATLAEALVFGSVDSEFKEVSLMVVETQRGDVVFSGKARASFGRRFRSGEEAVDAALQALSRASHRPTGPGTAEGQDESELPEPQ